MPTDLDEIIDGLYALAPDAFVSARNEAAKSLRKIKRSDDAAEIAKLAKPTAAAAALNSVARRRPGLIDSLLALGRQIREVQELVLSGEADATLLVRAADERRVAIRGIVQTLSDATPPGDARRTDEWSRTLEAASTDEELGARLRSGRFTKVALDGLGFDGLVSAAPTPRADLRLVPGLDAPADEERDAALAREMREQHEREQHEREQHEREQRERARIVVAAIAAEADALASKRAAEESYAASVAALDLATISVTVADATLRGAELELATAQEALARAARDEERARHQRGDADRLLAEAQASRTLAENDLRTP